VRDYVVQSGPLRTFDVLYDNRYEKLRPVGDYHTICVTGKPTTQRIAMASMSRSSEREIKFITALFTALAGGAHAIFGLRDITGGKAGGLAQKLFGLDGINWNKSLYGTTEDDLVIVELKNFEKDFHLIQEFVPPSEGSLFCYLTAASFDVFKLYWDRAGQAALKSKDDRFRRDIMILAPEAKMTLWVDPDGSYTVILHPKVQDVEAVEREITVAGEQAGMTITSAPGLFG
jgi:hypothetical protein